MNITCMDETWAKSNREAITDLAELLLNRRSSGEGKIIVFAGAAISIHAPSGLPTADSMVNASVDELLQNDRYGATIDNTSVLQELDKFIKEHSSSTGSSGRIIPPEMIYDAIYEFAGNKVFGGLDCLKSNRPNSSETASQTNEMR
jgi:hypothetical protein